MSLHHTRSDHLVQQRPHPAKRLAIYENRVLRFVFGSISEIRIFPKASIGMSGQVRDFSHLSYKLNDNLWSMAIVQ